jgi:hypothetical protein
MYSNFLLNYLSEIIIIIYPNSVLNTNLRGISFIGIIISIIVERFSICPCCGNFFSMNYQVLIHLLINVNIVDLV